ncbi:putative molybdate-transporting ATPase [Lupinus albus]|uniref:Putative molybdate-transporting ATPase n=1 Tax=Lupinus albus TaxID=3870 RepID=A0A6A4PKW1_LUPAL|nr:putative molybdate-transporting ATPase [Lupinus albus]
MDWLNHVFVFLAALLGNMFSTPFSVDPLNIIESLGTDVLGSETVPGISNFLETGFASGYPIYYLQNKCKKNSTMFFPFQIGATHMVQEIKCAQVLSLWRNNSHEINHQLYKGYRRGNKKRLTNEIAAAFDLLNSNSNRFVVNVWYNSTYGGSKLISPKKLIRIPRSVNLISNAYLESVMGPGVKVLLDFIKEMPKSEMSFRIEIGSLIGGLFFTWVILQLFPVVLTSLVYEKQQKLRIMMKMHGLDDEPYWMISYIYFLAISVIYILCLVLFGSLIGLAFFTLNDYGIQFVFFFIYINLQISLAFLASAMFSDVKIATGLMIYLLHVVHNNRCISIFFSQIRIRITDLSFFMFEVTAYIIVFGSGLLGGFLFQNFVQNTSFPRVWILVMEVYPGFALYRGLYEFSQFAFAGDGMRWKDLSNGAAGMKDVLIIMSIEWIVVLFVAYYVDQGSGGSPFSFLKRFQKKTFPSTQKPTSQMQGSKVMVQMEKHDVKQEREKVEQVLQEPTGKEAIVCDELKKVYPGMDGNPDKFAVRGLSLVVPQGECFGMLGPNGAGKTSFISMMIGLTKPSAGTAYVQGLDIRTEMNQIYTQLGVCPQYDLLWGSLTGREHLLFYGRLKNLKGSALTKAVEESLMSLNIFHGGVADKPAGSYSGGMKRRLSVAISLIGDPKVVYMDEPSTGLDPASRSHLWKVIKRAKQGRAIILTTHSMEEAEALCDRLGIFVNGSLQCVGNSKELKGRYGGSYVFTMTTSLNDEKDVENMVLKLSPNAKKIYHLSGTQKFELPKEEVKIADVFEAVENAKTHFTVSAWGIADTTMEDVFIKVARGAQESIALS